MLPTIRLHDGQLPRAVAETEQAMQAAGIEVYARAGTLVYPVGEAMLTADGDRVITAKLGEFTTDSFIEPVAESAIFQRWSVRRHAWVDVDPPLQLVRMVLSRERKWGFPRVAASSRRRRSEPTARCSTRPAMTRAPSSISCRGSAAADLGGADPEGGARGAQAPEGRAVRRILVQAEEPGDRPLGRPGGAPDRASARLAADGADHPGHRHHARHRQELPGRRHLHGRHRASVPSHHGFAQSGGDREAHRRGAFERQRDRVARQSDP